MSILDEDIMHIDETTGRFQVGFHNIHGIKEILRLPGQHPSALSYTLNADWPDKISDSIRSFLERIPIMELTDELIENILRGHVATQGRCWFLGPGHPQQLNREHDHHWELKYKRTKYSKPGAITVFPLYENGNP